MSGRLRVSIIPDMAEQDVQIRQTEQAARNNAIWCDTVCCAHGIPGEFYDSLWINRHPVPRFYSNAVALSDRRNATTQLAQIQALLDSDLRGNWSVKDSFCTLNLTDLGFQVLFEAAWLWRAPASVAPQDTDPRIQWTWVKDESELAQWETAWSGRPSNTSSTLQPRLFVPALLADLDVGFIAAYQDRAIVAGAIANRTDDVVGLSNVFAPAAGNGLFWAGCIATIQERFQGLPLVGYERGAELAAAQRVGFERLRRLRVWIRKG
jgi:hypothetical protein